MQAPCVHITCIWSQRRRQGTRHGKPRDGGRLQLHKLILGRTCRRHIIDPNPREFVEEKAKHGGVAIRVDETDVLWLVDVLGDDLARIESAPR
jgi:hypothetical protein